MKESTFVNNELRLDAPIPPVPARMAIVRFWIVYWWWFFALLPWMLSRQLLITAMDWWFAWRTAGRVHRFLGGLLIIGFVGNQELLVTAGFFGERFTWLRWDGIIIDPGPARFRSAVQAGLAAEAQPLAVVCTHWHEEHIGNAATIALQYAIPVIAAPLTC